MGALVRDVVGDLETKLAVSPLRPFARGSAMMASDARPGMASLEGKVKVGVFDYSFW